MTAVLIALAMIYVLALEYRLAALYVRQVVLQNQLDSLRASPPASNTGPDMVQEEDE